MRHGWGVMTCTEIVLDGSAWIAHLKIREEVSEWKSGLVNELVGEWVTPQMPHTPLHRLHLHPTLLPPKLLPSTPGLQVCGPSPVKCIRSGNLNQGYNSQMMFSQINADLIHRFFMSDGCWRNRMVKNKLVFIAPVILY